MEQLIAIFTNMLVLSSMYIVVALGFTLLFNMLGILNLSHGAIYMVGGYIGLALIVGLGLNQWVALILTALLMAVFGLFLERVCFRPFISDFNRLVMICVCIILVLQTTVNIIVGTQVLSLPPFAKGILNMGPVSITYERIVTFAVGAVLLVSVIFFVNRTIWGQQMQAISQDREGAALQGIDISKMSALACAMGCGLAAIAGCLVGAFLSIGPFMGDIMLVKILILVILAGVGSTGGIFITGIALGALDSILPMLVKGAVSDAVAIGIVIILLLIRPQGFFGHEA
jgi:branched-chain amino acid transport system permease protein